MNNKNHDNIDNLFKDAFNDWEVPPRDNMWDDISGNMGEDVDKVFKAGLEGKEVQPSEKVWLAIKEHLPLSLWLKRRLNSLSIMAGVLVLGMLAVLYFNREVPASPVTKPPQPERPVASEDALPIPGLMDVVAEEEELAIDNSLEEKIKSVKVKPVEEFVFDIDEEKMRKILEPLEPLPIESAVAISKKRKNKGVKEGKEAPNPEK